MLLDINWIKNIEAEQTLLWCILIDHLILNEINIQEEDFWDTKHKLIFKAMNALHKNKKLVDIITLKEFLEVKWQLTNVWWLEYIIELPNLVGTTANWYAYQEIIKEKANRRKIIKMARQIENIWFKEEESITENLAKIENISKYMFETFDVKEKDEFANTINYVNKFEDFRDSIKKYNWLLWIKSPYPLIDKYTKWIIAWKVYTIVAYSNVWKSKFSYSYVNHFLKEGKKVMYISLEVDKAMLFANILANYYEKDFNEVLNDKFYYEMWDFENLEIYDDLYKLQDILWMIKYKKPDIVFIDFIQNIQTSWSSEYEKMTEVAQLIQQTAIQTWTTIFSLSQANNESRFKKWESIQPKWSWAIFASSDIIIALYREEKELYLNILKNKYWKTNINFLLNVDFSKGIFNMVEDVQETIS